MKEKVLIICKGHQNIAGAQLYLQQLTPVFPPEKFDLHYAFTSKDGTRVFDEIARNRYIENWEYDWRHLPFLKSVFLAIRLYRKVAPHLIIFNSSEDAVLGAIWAAWLCRIPRRIMIVHWSLDPNAMPLFRRKPGAFFPLPSRYALLTRLRRGFAFNLLSCIIFVNNISREAYIRLFKVSARRCKTIYNGIDTEQFAFAAGQREEIRRQLRVSSEECMVLATGNLTGVKGHQFLITAVQRLVAKNIPIKCFIAGQGELRAKLAEQISRTGLQGHVFLLGYRDDIPSLLSGTDIFCMPSVNEALGYSILEALSAGIPVVASKVGGIPEVIKNGQEGILVPAGHTGELSDAIEHLWLHADLRTKMGQHGIKTVRERFSLQAMHAETAEFLTS